MSQFDNIHRDEEPDFRVDAKGIHEIRKAITHGLYAALEVEKVRLGREFATAAGQAWPADAIAVLPAESLLDTIQPMAEALLWLEQASHIVEVGT